MNWRKPLISISSALQGSNRMKYLSLILQYDKWSEKKLKALQKKKLEKLLKHAYKNVPYYKELFVQCGLFKNGKLVLKNFSKVPPLTKDILRTRFDELKSADMEGRKWFMNHSGGSTGEPTEFIHDREYDDWNIANKIYYKIVGGYKLGQKEMRLWGSEKDFMGDKEDPKLRFRNWLFNRIDLNAFTMTQEKMGDYIKTINKKKPVWIEGYVQPLYELAVFAKNNNLKIRSPKGVLSSAGTLYPYMKETIEEVFGCTVWNRYGSREVGDAAFGKDKLKLSVWNQFIDIVPSKDIGAKGMGKILVTTLNNFSMPLIKYDIGDIGKRSSKWGYLERIEGRESEVFYTKEGKVVPGLLFVHFLGVVMNDGSIKKYQMIQSDYDKIDIKIVVSDKQSFMKSIKDIEAIINKSMGYKCKITWQYVKDIPKLKSGKYLYVKTLVKPLTT